MNYPVIVTFTDEEKRIVAKGLRAIADKIERGGEIGGSDANEFEEAARMFDQALRRAMNDLPRADA